MVFEYDTSFPGFLCSCAELFNTGDITHNSIVKQGSQVELFQDRVSVVRDDERSRKFWYRISKVFSPDYLYKILASFLSDTKDADISLAKYMYKVYKKMLPQSDVSDYDAMIFESSSKRATGEAHLYKGMVRFSELYDNTYYAPIKPECNILPLIGNHFSARFNTMKLVIHDVKRSMAILYEPGAKWFIAENFFLDAKLDDIISDKEKQIRAMWKLYHTTIAIKERTNLKCQMNFMPRHYWEYITEMTEHWKKV